MWVLIHQRGEFRTVQDAGKARASGGKLHDRLDWLGEESHCQKVRCRASYVQSVSNTSSNGCIVGET